MTQKANIISGRELQEMRIANPRVGNLLKRIVSAITQTATSAGVSPVGQAAAPPTIGGVNVKASGEIVHVAIQDANPIHRSIEYHVEYANNPEFSTPHYSHLVASREVFLNLPSKTDAGAAQAWYVRAYSQYPGSQPSEPIAYGGLSPTAINLSGSTQLTPLTAPGSGTASPTGQQGGWGRGKVPIRPIQGPKRSIS